MPELTRELFHITVLELFHITVPCYILRFQYFSHVIIHAHDLPARLPLHPNISCRTSRRPSWHRLIHDRRHAGLHHSRRLECK